MTTTIDIPRIFTISESEHRIHNPFTAEKYATLGRVLTPAAGGAASSTLAAVLAKMLCTWARDHDIIGGLGIDMSPLFTAQAKQRAAALGVSDRVTFLHSDAAGYVAERQYDVAACIGATWIAGGVAGTVAQLARSLKPGGMLLIGEPWWRKVPATEEDSAAPAAFRAVADFVAAVRRWSPLLVELGYDIVEMVLADREGWDRYEAAKWLTMRRWLQANPRR